MIVLDVVCRAPVHETTEARQQAGCVCPLDWGSPHRQKQPQRPYVRGRVENHRGPRRATEPEADWVAVERAVGGDLSIRLTPAERDVAIDRLDRTGMSARQVAIRLGITVRTVQRRRSARNSARAS